MPHNAVKRILNCAIVTAITSLLSTMAFGSSPNPGMPPQPSLKNAPTQGAPSWKIEVSLQGTSTVGTGGTLWGPMPAGTWMESNQLAETRSVASGGSPTTLSIQGTAKFRITWTGTTPAPKQAWLLVDTTANWHNSNSTNGECSDAFADEPTASTQIVQGVSCPGKKSVGRRVLPLSLTNGAVEKSFPIGASTLVQGGGGVVARGSVSCGITVSIATKSASLSRQDQGAQSDPVHEKYEAHTLYSWTGSDDVGGTYNVGGIPGENNQTLQGIYAGTWNTKTYTLPSGGTAVLDDTLVTWSGSTGGVLLFQPPTPQSVRSTSYNGKMPEEDGVGQKTETWKFRVKDNGDGTLLDLEWKWVCHHIHENWVQTGTATEYTSLIDVAGFTVSTPSYTTPLFQVTPTSRIVTGLYLNADRSSLNVSKRHVGIDVIRSEFGQTDIVSFPGYSGSVTFPARPDNQGGYLFGVYSFRLALRRPVAIGTIDRWNSTGSMSPTPVIFGKANGCILDVFIYDPNGVVWR